MEILQSLAATGRFKLLLMHGRTTMHAILILQLHTQLILIRIFLVNAIGHLDKGLLPDARPIHSCQQLGRTGLRLAVLALRDCMRS
jgi:hypothetical protein